MPERANLTSLTTREAIGDALYRCVLGIDSNNQSLFESACLQDERMAVVAGPAKLEGWTAVNAYFQRLFFLVTTHTISNMRIESRDAMNASMTAHAMSYHIRPEDELKPEDMSYTASSLYDLNLVKDEDGLWKIKRWQIKVLWTTGDIKVLHP